MRAIVQLSQTVRLLTVLMFRSAGTEMRHQPAKTSVAVSPLNSESSRLELDACVESHLANYMNLQKMLDGGIPFNEIPNSRAIVQDAMEIAAQIESVPGFEEFEPLRDAHFILRAHWLSPWNYGASSPVSYRVRLKALRLYLRSRR